MTAAGSGDALRQPYDWKSDPAGGKALEHDRLTELKQKYTREQSEITRRRDSYEREIKRLQKAITQMQPQWDELEQRIMDIIRQQMRGSALIWLGNAHFNAADWQEKL